MALIPSPLARIHASLGAKFAEFAGWEMPLEYAGVLSEHQAVREAVGIFDVSHLGTLLIEGRGTKAYLNTRLTNDLGRITQYHAQYTLLLDENGGVVDDMIAYLYDSDSAMLIPNAANSDEVLERLRKGSPDNLRWMDRHRDDAIIAVQGPNSPDVLKAAGLPTDLGYMSFREETMTIGPTKAPLTVCRTGYTGERGYEIVVDAENAPEVWTALMIAGAAYGIQPCGLAARDTLRTEMGYPLHGNDLSRSISPVEARVGWAVGWKKAHFDGDQAARELKAEGPTRTLLGIRACGKGIPRHEMVVVDAEGNQIGQVTSGTFSPTLKIGIGLAFVPAATKPGDHVFVKVRNRTEEFEVVKPPFVPSHVTD